MVAPHAGLYTIYGACPPRTSAGKVRKSRRDGVLCLDKVVLVRDPHVQGVPQGNQG